MGGSGGASGGPEDHLQPDARAALTLPVEERIRYAQRDRWIDYTAAEKVLQRLRDLVQEPEQTRSHGLLVAGRPNNGKTSLLNRFRAENPYVALPDGTCEGPVVSMRMPDEPDEGKFWGQLLLALRIPHRGSDPAKVLKGQAKETLKAQRGRMLLVDDVHDVFRGGPMKQRHVLTLLKSLSNDLGIPIVTAGTAEAVAALHTDEQLTTRFDPVALSPWRPRTQETADLLDAGLFNATGSAGLSLTCNRCGPK